MIESFSITSDVGSGQLWADLFHPVTEPTFNLLIVHGMAEHRARYAEFAHWLAGHGGQVLVYDQAGHGQSAACSDDLGFFSTSHGDQKVIADLDQMLAFLIQKNKNIPTLLMGHSMGSLIVRDYLTHDIQKVSGVILTGTSGPNPALPIGRLLAQILSFFAGPKSRSKLLDQLLHADFLSHIDHPDTDFDWLTRDSELVKAYINDPWCGFLFTTSALLDLMAWTDRVSQKSWAFNIPADLPLLLASGSDDPVGQFSKGVHVVAERLEQAGRLVELIIYPGSRHEILNEINRESVYQDLFEWISRTVLK